MENIFTYHPIFFFSSQIAYIYLFIYNFYINVIYLLKKTKHLSTQNSYIMDLDYSIHVMYSRPVYHVNQ